MTPLAKDNSSGKPGCKSLYLVANGKFAIQGRPTGAIFEVAAAGYPGSIASGGRYDGLVAQLGSPDVPACGGSIGVECILATQATSDGTERLDVALTVLGAEDDLMHLACQIRAQGLRTGVFLESFGKLGKQMKWANDQRARSVLIHRLVSA